jgi:hypothetical protein
MDDRTVRLAPERHWQASDASDFDAEHEIYCEDAVFDYPQSVARIRGRHNIQQSRFVQLNKKRCTVRRIIGRGDDGLMAHEMQYFADRFEPAPSRAYLVERA